MDHSDAQPDCSLDALILATLRRHVAADAQLREIVSTPVDTGMSGAEIRRHRVTFDSAVIGRGRVSLVTKNASLTERRVLALLQDQHQPAIPFNHATNLADDRPALVCLEDLGDRHRPTSLDPIPPELLAREAEALARIHHANPARSGQLAWLPHVDREYVGEQLTHFWEPAWRQAVNDPAFRREFGPSIDAVEAAAAGAGDAIERLSADERTVSLIHGDINPSNVLIVNSEPRLIDWQAACVGPFYLDLPHHFPTLASAEHYRRARAALGDTIPPDDFAAGFRVAAHYIGLRYLWWTLDLWREDRSEGQWVRYYLNLIAL